MKIISGSILKIDEVRHTRSVDNFKINIYSVDGELVIPLHVAFLRNKQVEKNIFKEFIKDNGIPIKIVRARFRQNTSVISAQSCIDFWRQNRAILNELVKLEVNDLINEVESVISSCGVYIQPAIGFTIDSGIKLELFYIAKLGEYRVSDKSTQKLLGCCFQEFNGKYEDSKKACVATKTIYGRSLTEATQTFPLNTVLDYLESSCSQSDKEKPFISIFVKYGITSFNEYLDSIILSFPWL